MAAIVPRFLHQRTDNGFTSSHGGKSHDLEAMPGKPIAGPLWATTGTVEIYTRLLAGMDYRVRGRV